MECVHSLDEIRENMAVLDHYLEKKCESEYSFALERMKRGTCFIAVKSPTGYQFYPSRFMGYAHNSMDGHSRNTTKDGRLTNSAISKVLNQKVAYYAELDREYQLYCERLGFIPNDTGTYGVARKYWVFEK